MLSLIHLPLSERRYRLAQTLTNGPVDLRLLYIRAWRTGTLTADKARVRWPPPIQRVYGRNAVEAKTLRTTFTRTSSFYLIGIQPLAQFVRWISRCGS